MNTLVIYDTTFGNTGRIAEAIARGAGAVGGVRIREVGDATTALAERPDLLLVGGPTQRRGLSPVLRSFVESLPQGSLEGVAVVSFDTRYRGSTLFMGSAAREVAKRLEKSGARMVAPPESFFVSRGGPLERQGLEAGEEHRAEQWGGLVGAAALRVGRVTSA